MTVSKVSEGRRCGSFLIPRSASVTLRERDTSCRGEFPQRGPGAAAPPCGFLPLTGRPANQLQVRREDPETCGDITAAVRTLLREVL